MQLGQEALVAVIVVTNLLAPEDKPLVGRPDHIEAKLVFRQKFFVAVNDIEILVEDDQLTRVFLDADPSSARPGGG